MNDVLEDLVHILRMRSVLAYRHDENTNKSPKARNVILGYLDDDHENRPAASPTMTRNARQLLLQFGSWMGFSVAKGYVYGPVEAPVEWYITMSSVLEEGGWRRLKSGPLCSILIDPDLVATHKE